MKQTNIYFDYYSNEIKLTADEIKYFNDKVNKIKTKLNYTGKILNSNFEESNDKTLKNFAVGVCYKNKNDYTIFIDNYFIHDEYNSITKNTVKMFKSTIEETICHEIAHTRQWNHCKKHREITNNLLKLVL